MNGLHIWWLTLRPKTLLAAVGPILLGQALVAPGYFSWLTALLCLICAMALQIAVNLANDLFDGLSGVDQADRLGPPRALQSGLLSAQQLRRALFLTLGIALISGLWLILFGHWLLWLLGGLAILAVIGYSGGIKPYANLALGEVVVWAFFGPVAVLGSLLAHNSPISSEAIFGAILVGLPVAAILVVNNLRDRETDARAGKHTLSVRLGAEHSRYLFSVLTLLPPLVTLPLGAGLGYWLAWILILAAGGILNHRFWLADGPALNPLLAHSALYSLLVALWLIIYLTPWMA